MRRNIVHQWLWRQSLCHWLCAGAHQASNIEHRIGSECHAVRSLVLGVAPCILVALGRYAGRARGTVRSAHAWCPSNGAPRHDDVEGARPWASFYRATLWRGRPGSGKQGRFGFNKNKSQSSQATHVGFKRLESGITWELGDWSDWKRGKRQTGKVPTTTDQQPPTWPPTTTTTALRSPLSALRSPLSRSRATRSGLGESGVPATRTPPTGTHLSLSRLFVRPAAARARACAARLRFLFVLLFFNPEHPISTHKQTWNRRDMP
jgi:hypothetical protein